MRVRLVLDKLVCGRVFVLKTSVLLAMALLSAGVPMAHAEAVPLNWTSPTTARLNSVFMVSSSDGWAVGETGTIIRWTDVEWVPEFPPLVAMPLLMSLTLVVVVLAFRVSKKPRRASLSTRAQP